MKREEFKLLIENWRKNFIVESPKHDPHGVQRDLDQDDLYFADDYHDMPKDNLLDNSVETMDDPSAFGDFSHLDSFDKDFALDRNDHDEAMHSMDSSDEGLYSVDSNDEGRGFSGVYDDYSYESGDFSSLGGDGHEVSDREIDEAIDEAIDEDDECGY